MSSRRAGSPCGRIRGTARARARSTARRCSSWSGRWRSTRCSSPPTVSSCESNSPYCACAGAHEHQVLEQMREAGAAGQLVRRADAVPRVDRHDRHAVILVEDHVQAVRQRELRVFHLDRRRRRLGGGRGRQRQHEEGSSGFHSAILLLSDRPAVARVGGAGELREWSDDVRATNSRIHHLHDVIASMPEPAPLVGIIMGSKSDWDTMRQAAEILDAVRRAARVEGRLRAPHADADGRVRVDRRAPRARR